MDQFDYVDTIKHIMKMLGTHFGLTSEFVLHDLTNGIESTVIAIENNALTGRNVGDCGSNLGLELLRYEGKSEIHDSYGYNVFFKDGRVFRSSTTFFRDKGGKIIGSFCINTDVTQLIGMKSYIDALIPCGESQNLVIDEFFPHNINELLDTLIDNFDKHLGKDSASMSKEDKLNAVKYFDSKGAFLVTKAGSKICKYLGISKGTLYSYLDAVREEDSN